MTLNEIISHVDWNEVAIAIVSERPYQRPVLEGFRKVFESLMTMEPAESEYQIRIDRSPDVLDPEDTYPEVVGIKEGVDERWALSFCPWTVAREILDVAIVCYAYANSDWFDTD